MRAVFPVFVSVAWLLAAAPAVPHHSFAAVFDINRPIELTGIVSRLRWTNPHAWIYIDVEDANGNVQTWSVELLGINTLLKQGWTPDILKPGDAVHVKGFGARDGSTSGNASVFTMIDTGEQLWVSAPRDN
jgi:hypothetical protein